MALDLSILYRGPLASCNYDCDYCPFAKQRDSAAQLAADKAALRRFCDWVARRETGGVSILFTPWGEGLTRRWYREALVNLSNLPLVRKVAIQTNLSCRLDWVRDCDPRSLGLWCTWHPSQVSRGGFVAKCRELDNLGTRYSVGVVGLKEHMDEIKALREELSPNVYLWINALKRSADYYTRPEILALEAVDPLFRVNNTRHASFGRDCRTGETAISVDGDGTIRRCHFIQAPLGNLYDSNLELILKRRPCTNGTCGCHIGYVHMNHLRLYERFAGGVLERIPKDAIWRDG